MQIRKRRIKKELRKKKIEYDEFIAFINRCEVDMAVPMEERIVKVGWHQSFVKKINIEEILDKYKDYLRILIDNVIDRIIESDGKKSTKKLQENEGYNLSTYIDDFNNIRSKGNYLPKRSNNTVYISDDIIYDRVSKIKYMLVVNGICPKKALVKDIYMIQTELGKNVTLAQIEELRKERSSYPNDLCNRIEKVHKEIYQQKELER